MISLPCGSQVTRIILLILNIVFILFGGALLRFGIYLKAGKKFDVALSPHINAQIIGGAAIATIGTILIIAGIFTMILSVLGCVGTLFKRRVFLIIYAIALAILMTIELAAFIAMMSSRVRIRDSYNSGLWNIFNDAYSNHDENLIKQIEELELEFKCCGVIDYHDYEKVNYTTPISCYEQQSPSKRIFDRGCADAIIDWIWDELPIVGGILGAFILIEIFGLVSSISLAIIFGQYSKAKLYSSV